MNPINLLVISMGVLILVVMLSLFLYGWVIPPELEEEEDEYG